MVQKSQSPSLFLVGAGPGDPELMTLKGFKALQNADVILYDHLANRELLNMAGPDCEKVYVGKQPYGNYTPQEVIHEMIKHYAYSRGNVVRLKGGDPFIFGRGFEEVLFARSNGISASYIPGITSMQVSGLLEIPLTHRGISESIWSVTGTNKDGQLSKDLIPALRSSATVVIYMGMKNLAKIVLLCQKYGRESTPAAIIQNGSHANQRYVVCKACELVKESANAGLGHPAIIIIGEVVRISYEKLLTRSTNDPGSDKKPKHSRRSFCDPGF